MKKTLILLLIFLASNSLSFAKKDKDAAKKTTLTAVNNLPDKDSKKGYASLITKDAISTKGLIDIHLVKDVLYFEIPVSVMEKPMLLASKVSKTSDNSDVIAGQMPVDPLMIDWSFDTFNVYLRVINPVNICDQNESIYPGFKLNNLSPVYKAFPIKCYNADSTKIVVDVTKYFLSDQKPLSPFIPASPFDALFGMKKKKGSFKQDMSRVLSAKSFPENIILNTNLVFDADGTPFTAQSTVSIILLPNNLMKPRIGDRRVGYFADRKLKYTTQQDYLDKISYINRWRLEPKEEDVEKYKRGELVEPKKQIVYYLDPAFPAEWRQFMKEGIEDWQMAFEKIGFKNAIVAKDYPTDDPNFNPDDIRYSCIRYSASNFANAMGPSWTDPRTGEILQGSVYVYHNVLSLLHNWRFIQTSAVDPKARDNFYGMDVKGPLLRYLIAHEIGHTLGLMHNMRGSYAYAVDSLRSKSFTDTFGTTSSIMDYARYNYVAQPGDGVTNFLPPRIGLYDFYAIKVGYAINYDAKSIEDDYKIINKWITEKQNDPIYKFGEQEIFSTSDPAAQSESLGDDAIKASEYGIKNLKVITNNLVEWTRLDGKDYTRTEAFYSEIMKQFSRYMGHCIPYIGGYYNNYAVSGDGQDQFIPITKAKQKEALQFVLKQVSQLPQWYANEKILKVLPLDVDNAAKTQISIIRRLCDPTMLGRIGNLEKVDVNAYTQKEYIEDVYNFIWAKTVANKALNESDKLMQYIYMQTMLGALDMLPAKIEQSKGGIFGFAQDDMLEIPYITKEAIDKYLTVSTKEADVKIHAKPLIYSQLNKLKTLLNAKASTATGLSKDHYQYLSHELNKLMNK